MKQTGNTSRLFDFLERLAANNSREWFAENKAEYLSLRDEWLGDVQRLINALAVYEPALAHVQAKDCAYRIYRDTRFSADKTPLKTYFSALISPTGRHSERAAYYLHMGVDECALYDGVWCPDSKTLKKLRKAIVDNIEEFRGIVEDKEVVRLFPGWWGRALKTAPKGYDRDHPDIEFLRLTEYGKCHNLDREFFDAPDWPEKAAAIMAVLKPMCDFLNYSIDEEI